MSNIKKNAIFNVLLAVSQILFPLITFPYVSRVLGPKGIGEVSFVDSFTQYFILVAALGIPIYGIREIAKVKNDPQKRSQIFCELCLIHIITTCIAVLIYVGVFFTFNPFSAQFPLFVIGSGLLFLQVFMMEWLFQGLEEFPYITKRALFVRVIAVFAIFLLVRDQSDTFWYYGISLGSLCVNIAFNIRHALRFIRIVHVKSVFAKHWKPLFYIFSLGVVTSVYTILDTAFLGMLSTTQEVGYYTASMRLVKLVITVFVAFSTVMIPSLSSAFHKENYNAASNLLRKSFGYIVLISVPAGVGLMVIAPLVLQIYAGPEFSASAASLRWLAPTIICISLSNLFGMQILNPTNNERLFFKAAMIGMCISLLINITLIPIFGQVGAAFSSFCTELTVVVLLGGYALNRVPFRPEWKLILRAFIASLAFIPIYWFFQSNDIPPLLQLISILGISSVTYLVVQFFIFRNHYVVELWVMAKKKLAQLK